jgi:hypothetical protein
MKYDIYKGTKEDLEDSGGELLHEKYNKFQVAGFCTRHGINAKDFFDGDYITVGETGFWLEEAM